MLEILFFYVLLVQPLELYFLYLLCAKHNSFVIIFFIYFEHQVSLSSFGLICLQLLENYLNTFLPSLPLSLAFLWIVYSLPFSRSNSIYSPSLKFVSPYFSFLFFRFHFPTSFLYLYFTFYFCIPSILLFFPLPFRYLCFFLPFSSTLLSFV